MPASMSGSSPLSARWGCDRSRSWDRTVAGNDGWNPTPLIVHTSREMGQDIVAGRMNAVIQPWVDRRYSRPRWNTGAGIQNVQQLDSVRWSSRLLVVISKPSKPRGLRPQCYIHRKYSPEGDEANHDVEGDHDSRVVYGALGNHFAILFSFSAQIRTSMKDIRACVCVRVCCFFGSLRNIAVVSSLEGKCERKDCRVPLDRRVRENSGSLRVRDGARNIEQDEGRPWDEEKWLHGRWAIVPKTRG